MGVSFQMSRTPNFEMFWSVRQDGTVVKVFLAEMGRYLSTVSMYFFYLACLIWDLFFFFWSGSQLVCWLSD